MNTSLSDFPPMRKRREQEYNHMLCHNFETGLNHTKCAIARKVRLVGITVSRTSRSLATAHPVLEGQRGRIDTANDTEGGEGNVGDYLAPGLGTSTEVKKGLRQSD
jgi:hypothetical protein